MGREWYKKTMMLLVVLVAVIINLQEATVALECINGTSSSSLGACLPDEFLMESGTSTMLLGRAPVKRTSYDVTGRKAPICKEDIYGNCIGNPNVKSTTCTYANRCKHKISNGNH